MLKHDAPTMLAGTHVSESMSLNGAWACRGYPQKKISENVECEIMHVIVQEAMDSYR